MDTIGIRELRADLAGIVRRASGGQRAVVTIHGRPVAQLAPLGTEAPALDQLIASGALIAPRRRSTWRAPAPVAVWAGARVDRALRELRG